jgi:hypothetical protein
MLQVGTSDSVGLLVHGKQEYTFKYSCPRGRWVHLAVTASAVTAASNTPKGGTPRSETVKSATACRLELFAYGRCVSQQTATIAC